MKIKLNVTRKHIMSGDCGDINSCAIAQAVADQFAGAMVKVGGTVEVYNSSGNIVLQSHLPVKALNFMERFDSCDGGWSVTNKDIEKAKRKLKPVSFTLDFQVV